MPELAATSFIPFPLSGRRRAIDIQNALWPIEDGAMGIEHVTPEKDVWLVCAQDRSSQHGARSRTRISTRKIGNSTTSPANPWK
jgi:hypothetical protein